MSDAASPPEPGTGDPKAPEPGTATPPPPAPATFPSKPPPPPAEEPPPPVEQPPAEEAPEEQVPPVPKLEGFVKVDPAKLAPVKVPPRKPYWCGVVQGSPFQNFTLFGVDFPTFEGRVSFGVDGQPDGRIERGKVHYLTVDQVEGIRKAVARGVIRGDGENAAKLSVEGRGYRPMAGDRSVGEFVYMVPISATMPFGWREAAPETMVDPK